MTISNTFNGLPITSRQVLSERRESTKVYEVTLDCVTNTYSEITNLAALVGEVTKTRLISGYISIQTTGTKATLVINGTSHTNCVIDSLTIKEADQSLLGVWYYTISFAQETIT
jgi:hypothetical protein